MGLAAEFTASSDSTFINRCTIAAIAFAINVIQGESTTVGNHTNRANFAKNVVNNPSQYASNLARGVIALNAVDDGALLDDTAVNNGIAAIWNIYAGTL